MRPLSLDYRRDTTASKKIGLSVLSVGIAVAVAVGFEFKTVDSELASAEERTGHLEMIVQRQSGVPRQSKPTPELQQEARQANEVLLQLALPWEGLFKTLEASNNDRIALLAIQPDVRKHAVKLNGEAKDFSALVDYLKLLQQDKAFSDIALLNHEINTRDPEKPVRFALSATWRLQP